MAVTRRTVDDGSAFEHPLYKTLLNTPGLSVSVAPLDDLLTWGLTNSLWVFPMATSCCGIELMAAAAGRVDLDRMGTIVRGTPRQADVMVVAGTITVKMAPRVKLLWDQMPEPKWCIAMGSCAISGDFYRELYSVVPGVDTFLPVDVYVPGCPPNPEALMHGLLRLQEKVQLQRQGQKVVRDPNPALLAITKPSVPRLCDADRTAEMDAAQEESAATSTASEPRAPLHFDTPAAQAVDPDLQRLFAENGVKDFPREGPALVPAAQHLALARKLKAQGFRQLVSIVASHWPAGRGRKGADAEEPEHFEVAYLVRSVGSGTRVATWAVRLAPGESIASLVPVYAGADWQEREQYDLVGVPFADHPDLRRLMMAENYSGHPLRRDFAADTAAAPWR
ncbi:MAG: NADH-quinone oxidoreductase subunit NuoB [Planctomycetota bacterium]|nr:NADH-quinone oxidoreductase subunit NuoB [Planctomycetota bacterium]